MENTTKSLTSSKNVTQTNLESDVESVQHFVRCFLHGVLLYCLFLLFSSTPPPVQGFLCIMKCSIQRNRWNCIMAPVKRFTHSRRFLVGTECLLLLLVCSSTRFFSLVCCFFVGAPYCYCYRSHSWVCFHFPLMGYLHDADLPRPASHSPHLHFHMRARDCPFTFFRGEGGLVG